MTFFAKRSPNLFRSLFSLPRRQQSLSSRRRRTNQLSIEELEHRLTPSGNISTIAGTGSYGYSGDGGPATSAKLYFPFATAVDSSGNIYIADTDNNRIREVVASTGNIITVAGNGTGGYSGDNGPATSAEISHPYGVAVDSSGNIYFSDYSNARIREVVKATGNIITLAGNGTFAFSGDGGPATSAEINYPEGIAVDSSGNVFFSDEGNERIREIVKATGIITTVAGIGLGGYSGDGGQATSAEVFEPNGVAVDSSGNLFIADYGNNRIREVANATGIITTVAGTGTSGYSGDGGAATSAKLDYPNGVAVDSSGDIYIADTSNYRIREVAKATGIITTIAGNGTYGYSGDGGPATSAELSDPYGLAVDANGDVFIADSFNERIREVVSNAALTLGSLSTAAWTVNQPGYSGTIAVTGGTAPYSNLTVTGLPAGLTASLSGSTVTISGTPTATGTYSNINVSVKDSTGTLASHTYTITVNAAPTLGTLSPTQWSVGAWGYPGTIAISFGTAPFTLSAQANLPAGLSATITGSNVTFTGTPTTAGTYTNIQLTVKDATGATVSGTYSITTTVPPAGSIITFAGTGTGSYSGDGGIPTAAALDSPESVAVDSSGNVYIADMDNNRVREVVKATGDIITVAGNGAWGYSGDGGQATSAELAWPTGVAVDSSGNLYIADEYNHRIREVSKATGIITTIAGTGSSTDSGDGGDATSAGIAMPGGVAVDSSGNVYIADWQGNRIREVAKATGIITTIAGNGTLGYSGDGGLATSAELYYPEGVAVDANGDVYIADTGNNRVREIAQATGIITTIAGTGTAGFSGDGGPATSAKLSGPQAVYLDPSGDIFIADSSNQRIREVVKATGNILTVAGNGSVGTGGDGGSPTSASLDFPYGVAVDATGNVFIADTDNNRIREIPNYFAPTLGSLSATAWTVNRAGYSGTIGITSGTAPYSNLTVTGLPAGLTASLSGSTITISGTPTASGTFNNITVSIQDAASNSASRTYTLTINAAPTLGSLSLTQWTVSQPSFYGTIAVTGGTGPFGNFTATGVPGGLSASLSGSTIYVSGTPGAAGTFGMTVSATDATGAVASGTFAITINAIPTPGSLTPTQWTVGQPGYTGTIPVSGGTGPLTLNAASNLPPGLSAILSGTTITLSGTPTTAVTYSNVVLIVRDSTGATNSGTYTITINAAPTLGTLSTTAWTVNQAGYSGTIAVTGGTSPFSNLTVTGLPSGLSAALSGNTITVSGTPTATGSFNSVNVSIKDASGYSVSHTYSITINPAPTLGTLSQTQWTVNRTGYSSTIAVTGGTGAYSSLTYSGLPTGLSASLSGSTITVSGTPTATGSFSNATISLKDATGATASHAYSMTINALPTLGTLSITAWTVNQSGYTGIIGISGGTGPFNSLTVTGLPAGLSAAVNGPSIMITGVPTATGTFTSINVSVKDVTGAATSGTYSMTINPAPSLGGITRSTWTVTRAGFTGTIPVTGGTGPLTLASQANLPPGLNAVLSGTTISFTGTPTTTGVYSSVSLTARDNTGATVTHTYTIIINALPTLSTLSTAWTVNSPGFYSVDTIVGGSTSFTNMNVTGLPAGVSAYLAGNLITFGGTPTAVGTFNNINISVQDATGAVATGTASITINPAPTLGALSNTAWTVGQAGFSGTISITGGTQWFSNLTVTGLPAGLTATQTDATTITISGTPTVAGSFNNINVSITDAAHATATGTFSITINAAPTLGSLSSTAWTVNQAGFSSSLAIAGGTSTFSNLTVSGLPAGLSAALSGSTITISGTPTATGSFNNVSVSVTDAAGAVASGTFAITINAAPTLGSLTPGQWTVGQGGYSDTIAVNDGTGPFVVSAQANLPPGLTAIVTGTNVTFTGTPTTVGSFNNVQLTVQDAAGATASGTFSITINPAPTLGSLSQTQWTVNQFGYSDTIGITGGTGAFSNLTATDLPSGLSATLSGNTITLSGTPTASGTFNNINVSVMDAAGATASSTFSITVNAAPTLGSLTISQWTLGQSGYTGAIPLSGGTGALVVSAQANLPPGLIAIVTGTNVTFSGTPTSVGTFNSVQLTVQDATGASSTGTFSITINAAPTLGSLSVTQWTVNQAGYSGTIAVTGGTTTFSNLTATGLPPGLSAVLNGTTITLSGTPTATGTFNSINVSVTDAAGATASGTFAITINPTGLISTVAGNGTAGYSGDGGASAQLNGPSGVAVDSSGDLFIADTVNNCIREVVQATGNIITVAGTGVAGDSGDGAAATSARLNAPSAVAVDASGDLFIADTGNNVIREVIQATGIIITVAGNGTAGDSGDGGAAAAAQLNSPHGVAVDSSGNLFIADTGNNVIREVVQATGNIITVAGTGAAGYSGDGGPASSAELNAPFGVAVDANGNIFIADTGNNAVREVVQATGYIITVAGTGSAGYSGDGATATSAQLNGPVSVAVDSSGNLFIADAGNNVVREVVQATGYIVTVAGTGTAGYSGDGGLASSAQLNGPDGVTVDANGDLFIGDTGNNCIRKVR
jgi:hypothetical protein